MRSTATAGRGLTTVLFLVYLAGCTSWEYHEVSPERVIEAEQPHEIRVTLSGGERVVLQGPVVRNDTLSGLAVQRHTAEPFAVPVEEVAAVEVKETHGPPQGAIAVAGGVVALLAIVAVISMQDMWN